MSRALIGALIILFALFASPINTASLAQSCVTGAAINDLISRGEIVPVSAINVGGTIRRVEAVCQSGSGYVYVLVIQVGQDVRRVEVNASQ